MATKDSKLVGCGYCATCGYGGEPSDECLHKRPVALVRAQHVAQERHRRLETARIEALRVEARKEPVRTYGAVYVTIGKNGKPRFHNFWRGRLWPISRESAEKSFAEGATIYRKKAGVSIWVEAPEVFIG